MSKVDELIGTLTEDSENNENVEQVPEEIITGDYVLIGDDRFIRVPERIKKLGVGQDTGVNTVRFIGPRYSENKSDISKMNIYVNFMRSDGYMDACPCTNVTVDPDDEEKLHYEWEISRNVTDVHGNVTILVCAKDIDESGIERNHWNTELYKDFYVSEGMEVMESVISQYPDLIEHLLLRVSTVEDKTTQAAMLKYVEQYLEQDPSIIIANIEEIISNGPIQQFVDDYLDEYVDICTTEERTLEGSYVGAYEMAEMRGVSEQANYPGYQLFDYNASEFATFTSGGATVTNNGDGSFTVTGSGALTVNVSKYHYYTLEESIKLFKAGTLKLKCKGTTTVPKIYIHPQQNGSSLSTLAPDGKTEFEITQEMIDSGTFRVVLGIYSAAGQTIVPGTISVMLYQDGDGELEPFTGGKPSPNPEYRQEVESSLESVSMSQGYWNTIGQFIPGSGHVSNRNLISCKPGDVVAVTVEKELESFSSRCFGSDGSNITHSVTRNGKTYTFTVPNGAESCCFILVRNGLTPDTVGKVEATINGNYIATITTIGKNLLKPSLAVDTTINGITFTKNDDNSITLNGTATASTYYDFGTITLEPGEYKFSGCTGGSNSSYLLYMQSAGSNEGYIDIKNGEKVLTVTHTIERKVMIAAYKDAVISNITIHPMISRDGGEYEPYRETVAQIVLLEPLRSNGNDISDIICKKDGKWGVERWIGTKLFNGSSPTFFKNDGVDGNDNYLYVANFPHTKAPGFSPQLKHVDSTNAINKGNAVENLGFMLSYNNCHLFMNVGCYLADNTIGSLTEYLTANPIEIHYVKSEPTWEELDEASQNALDNLEVYDGVTHVFVDSYIQPIVMSKYGTSECGAKVITQANEIEKLKEKNVRLETTLASALQDIQDLEQDMGDVNTVLESLIG